MNATEITDASELPHLRNDSFYRLSGNQKYK